MNGLDQSVLTGRQAEYNQKRDGQELYPRPRRDNQTDQTDAQIDPTWSIVQRKHKQTERGIVEQSFPGLKELVNDADRKQNDQPTDVQPYPGLAVLAFCGGPG